MLKKYIEYFTLTRMMLIAFANDIRDIKPPIYFPANYLILAVLGSIILLVILAFLAIFIFKKIKKKKTKPLLLPKTAHQIAYEALEALRLKNLPNLGRVKEYYFELSNIIRRYIENRFSIKAPEMTTEEFLFFLRDSSNLSGKHKNLLKDFLTLCDIVKFAKYGPNQKEIDDSFNAAGKFVDETKAVEMETAKVAKK